MRKAGIIIISVGVLAFLYYKFRGGGAKTMYEFPNGFNDLDNWSNADDGSDSLDNRKTRLMVAIAKAEGFGIPGAIPTRANNPGDLTRSLGFDETGEKLGSAGIVVFSSRDEGWGALDRQLSLIQKGASVHKLTDTILSFAHSYTATEQTIWAENVARELGADTSVTLAQYLA